MKIPSYDYFKDLKTQNFLRLAIRLAQRTCKTFLRAERRPKNWQFFSSKQLRKIVRLLKIPFHDYFEDLKTQNFLRLATLDAK